MDEKIKKTLETWVKNNYKQHTISWTYERSEGNFADCFCDGYECGTSWAAYEVGAILGMVLDPPKFSED